MSFYLFSCFCCCVTVAHTHRLISLCVLSVVQSGMDGRVESLAWLEQTPDPPLPRNPGGAGRGRQGVGPSRPPSPAPSPINLSASAISVTSSSLVALCCSLLQKREILGGGAEGGWGDEEQKSDEEREEEEITIALSVAFQVLHVPGAKIFCWITVKLHQY